MSKTAQETIDWGGYTFNVYSPQTDWNDVPGVYIFTGVNEQNQWVAYYVGESESFKTRPVKGHERWDEAVALGATHVHARGINDESTRLSVEAELIAAYRPPLNTQGK